MMTFPPSPGYAWRVTTPQGLTRDFGDRDSLHRWLREYRDLAAEIVIQRWTVDGWRTLTCDRALYVVEV